MPIHNGIIERIDKSYVVENPSVIVDKPGAVKIELSGACNLQCNYCWNKFSPRKKLISEEDFKYAIDQVAEMGIEEVGLLYLGESTLHPKLIDFIKYTKSKGIPYVFLTSNGLLIKDKLMKEMAHSGLDSLKWSCNHPNKEEYLKETGIDGFNILLDNMKAFYEYREENHLPIMLYASTAVYDVNNISEEIKEFVNTKLMPYIDEHYYFDLTNQGGLVKYKFEGSICNKAKDLPCPRLWNNSYISSDMKMMCCCGGFTDDFIVGDLKKNTFKKIWNGEPYKLLRQKHLDGDLSNCVCTKEK